jgi:hypothetical protein
LYRRLSIRISTLQAEIIRRIALEDGWEFADLIRVLICIGADAAFLSLNNPERRRRFSSKTYLAKALSAFDAMLGKPTPRGYSIRHGRDTSVLSIRTPKSFDMNVRRYAAGSSVNATYEFFLVSGLILHMKGQATLLGALNSTKQKSNPSHRARAQFQDSL